MRRDELSIQTPCQKDFSAMKPADAKKRFCGECKKHVHDLARMSEREAKALLRSEATEGLCIRYVFDQHGQVLFAPSTLVRAKRFLLGAAAVALPLSVTACMGAAAPPPPTMMGAMAPMPSPDASAPIATDSADAGAPTAPTPR